MRTKNWRQPAPCKLAAKCAPRRVDCRLFELFNNVRARARCRRRCHRYNQIADLPRRRRRRHQNVEHRPVASEELRQRRRSQAAIKSAAFSPPVAAALGWRPRHARQFKNATFACGRRTQKHRRATNDNSLARSWAQRSWVHTFVSSIKRKQRQSGGTRRVGRLQLRILSLLLPQTPMSAACARVKNVVAPPRVMLARIQINAAYISERASARASCRLHRAQPVDGARALAVGQTRRRCYERVDTSAINQQRCPARATRLIAVARTDALQIDARRRVVRVGRRRHVHIRAPSTAT